MKNCWLKFIVSLMFMTLNTLYLSAQDFMLRINRGNDVNVDELTFKQRFNAIDEVVILDDSNYKNWVVEASRLVDEYFTSLSIPVRHVPMFYTHLDQYQYRPHFGIDGKKVYKYFQGKNVLGISFDVRHLPDSQYAVYIFLEFHWPTESYFSSRIDVGSFPSKSSNKRFIRGLAEIFGTEWIPDKTYAFDPLVIMSNWKEAEFRKYLQSPKYLYEGIYDSGDVKVCINLNNSYS